MSRLKPAEKLRMRLVCRRWAEVFHQNHMWQRLDLRTLFRTFNSDKIFIFSELAGEALKEINLSGCWQIGDEDLRVLSVTCPNISILSISNCWKISDKGLSALAQGLTRLTELDMSYCGQLTCSSFTDHNWGRLQKVDFSYCKQMGDEHLEALLSRTSDIRSLSFRRCTRITDFGLFLVVRYCRRLQFLDLGDCDHISDKCLKWIASSCTNLAYLNLRFCTRITNGGLYDLSLGVQNFTSLKLNHCTQLTDASIIFFSDNIRSLRHMYLRRCRKITETTANYLLQASPQLQLLDMTGCPHVSSRIKAAIEGPHPGITVRVDMTREERGIPPPRFVSKEMPVNVKYTSGPRDVMLGITTRNKTGDAIGAGGASREGREKKKKKGSKSPSNSFMMD